MRARRRSTSALNSDAGRKTSIFMAMNVWAMVGSGQPGHTFMKGPGNYEKSEIPEVFESMSFGWYNYQGAGKGFVAWIDDIALAKDRLGARGVLPPAKPAKK